MSEHRVQGPRPRVRRSARMIRRLAVPIAVALGRHRRVDERRCPAVGGGRRGACGGAERAGLPVAAGDEAHRQGVRRVRFRQRRDDRAGRRSTPRRRRPPLLRHPGPATVQGHHTRRAHPGLLGRSADRGAAPRARTARPPMCRCICAAIKARRCPTNPSTPSATSSPTHRHRPGSRPTSPAPRR